MIVDDIEQRIEQLAALAREAGHPVSPVGLVSERTAAYLLNFAAGTLRNWRYGERPLPFRRLGSARGRIRYELRDIAAFLTAAKDES